MFNNYYYLTKRAKNCLSSFLQCLLCYIAPQYSVCVWKPRKSSQQFTPVYSTAASSWSDHGEPRAGITRAGQVRSGRDIWGRQTNSMELSLGDIAAVVIYFLLILGIGFWVKRAETRDLQPFLSCFSLWSDPTAGQWRAISWQGSTCSGCPWEPPSLPETLAASTSLGWQALGLRQDSV